MAGRGSHLIKLRIAPVDAVNLVGGHLQLFVQHQSCPAQDAISKLRIQRRSISRKNCTVWPDNIDRAVDDQAISGLIECNAARGQAGAVKEHFNIALSDKGLAPCGYEHAVGDQCRGGLGVGHKGKQRKKGC